MARCPYGYTGCHECGFLSLDHPRAPCDPLPRWSCEPIGWICTCVHRAYVYPLCPGDPGCEASAVTLRRKYKMDPACTRRVSDPANLAYISSGKCGFMASRKNVQGRLTDRPVKRFLLCVTTSRPLVS